MCGGSGSPWIDLRFQRSLPSLVSPMQTYSEKGQAGQRKVQNSQREQIKKHQERKCKSQVLCQGNKNLKAKPDAKWTKGRVEMGPGK